MLQCPYSVTKYYNAQVGIKSDTDIFQFATHVHYCNSLASKECFLFHLPNYVAEIY